jgi:membrane-associated phospholipid phosphatase
MGILTQILADGLLLPICLLAVYVLVWRVPQVRRYTTYTRVIMAGITSYISAKLIGATWQPEALRPFEQLGVSAGASSLNNPGFPSDHALFATFLTIAVWYITRSINMTATMAALTVLMCVGRVLALVHTPLDVVGGIAIGTVGAVWYFHDKTFLKNPLAKKAKR